MKNPAERRILQLVVATGIASVVTQLLFVRELLAQFQGNELIIALVLFNWLVLGGIGTRLALGAGNPRRPVLVGLSLALALLGALALAAMRILRPALFGTGISVGFYPILLFSLLTMAPYALLVGYVLPYSLFTLRKVMPGYPGTRVYLADNLGDIGGGVLFTFVLVIWTTPMAAALLAHLPLIIAAVRLARGRFGRWVAPVAVGAVLLCTWLAEERLIAPPVGRLVHYEESRFARLTVLQDQEQITLFADGRPMSASQDLALAEQLVHYPLCQVDRARRILLLSAQGGMMEEIAKYHPEVIDYVELDPAVARLMRRFGLLPPLPGLHFVTADGRAWLRKTRTLYDAILVNLPEPDTFQLNRFFTDQFFALAARHLTPGGIFSFNVEGAANRLTDAQRHKLSSLWVTARRSFAHVALLPGERIFFLCAQHPLDLDIPGRLATLGIATQVAGPYFYGDVTSGRIGDLGRRIDKSAPVNRDTRPYLMQVMWAQWFTKFGDSPHHFMVVAAVLLALYLLRMRREEYILFSTGLLAMGSEIVLIFAFQIFLGYVYSKIGMIVTAFLAGLLPGAWLGTRPRRPTGFLIFSDAALIGTILSVTGLLHYGGDRLPPEFYYIAAFLIALLCGFQIPLALMKLGDDNRAAARIFSVDLVGAAFGALLTSTVFIPYLGLGGAAAALMGVKIISLLLMGEQYASHRSTHLYHG